MQYLAKQSADEMRLQGENVDLITDDPTVVAGEKYQGEEFELQQQYKLRHSETWIDCSESKAYDIADLTNYVDYDTRQILRRKAEGEKGRELNGWISVKDRLPEDHSWVLASADGAIRTVGYDTKNGFSYWDIIDIKASGFTITDIDHWIPLPEPPKPLTPLTERGK